MGSLEAGHRYRDHLPAINFIGRGPAPSPTPLVSPTTMYPNQPPSYFSTTPTSSGPGYISPREPRRPPDDEKEKQPPRQSLPSIHEALGNDNSLPYPPPPTSAPPQQSHSAPPPHHLNSNPRRPGVEGPSGPPNPFSNGAPAGSFSTLSHQTQLQLHTEASRTSLTSLNTQDSRNASLQSLSSGKSPTQSASTGITSINGSQTGSGYDYNPPTSAGSVASPNGYGGYSQPFPFQSQPPPGAPVYPTTTYDSRPYVGARVDDVKGGNPGHSFAGLNDSVKRHLEVYDVETSLNEIVDMSTRSLDFSRHYASRAHQAGPVMGSLPLLQEVEEMINIQRRHHDALMRIRTAVLNEHALAEQMAQRKAFKPGGMHDDDRMAMYQEEFKGSGFTGPDSKKRRGKAAPPGRCHSCNRAETPEWRRGPDGARTLCNACGLHYAKLTRKMGNKAVALGSNLKPKTALGSLSPRSH
ncbi:hypothetical protein BDW59DRAFT_392 [Aspergillus cavernicola]|uniref:GATA-type domain-containing protein n=1 Tax=Aspergillus cavernicola TaxID=176166 RepID=A0ABR4J4B4_9EURO